MRKLLVGYAIAGVNGENTATLSMAESWVRKGGSDFDIKIFVNTEDVEAIKKQLSIFDKRLSALQSAGVNITVYTAPSADPVISYGDNDPLREYTSGLVYPMPSVSVEPHINFTSATARVLTTKSLRRLRYSEGLWNLRTVFAYQKFTGNTMAQITRKKTTREHLEFCQQPRHIDVTPIRPAFLEDKPYYLFYCNPDICAGLYHRGVNYLEAFLTFTLHGLSNYPDQEITIYQNSRKAPDLCGFKAIARQLIKINPNLIIQYDAPSSSEASGDIITVPVQNEGATGPVVNIKLYPRMSNPEFLGFMQQAEIAAVTSSGSGDELLAMGRACLFIDGGILNRIKTLFAIIKIANKADGSFALLHRFFNLQREIHTFPKFKGKQKICTALAALFSPENRAALDVEFQQLRDLLERDYNLSDELYAALDELAVSLGYTPHIFAPVPPASCAGESALTEVESEYKPEPESEPEPTYLPSNGM
ncbi:MAG: hypothetical protein P1U34_08260 [Coxiellaceae bacterium]|nr:hypothetical protein [Coxiellaceae bacterium]